MSDDDFTLTNCARCEGSGFSGSGTGYDAVYSECGGQRVHGRDQFHEDLEAVFEERTKDMSPALCALLRSLWREGVKHGRHLERNAASSVVVPSAESRGSSFEETRAAILKQLDVKPSLNEHRLFLAHRPKGTF